MAMMVKCSNNLVGPIRKHETVVSHGQPSLMMANKYQLCIRQSWHKRHHHQTNNKIPLFLSSPLASWQMTMTVRQLVQLAAMATRRTSALRMT